MKNETDFKVIIKAKELMFHTLQITSNSKKFPKKYRHSLCDKIQIKSMEICNLFIDSTEGRGIPLGNQINQGFALLYLDGMDKFIKYELGIKYYGRYMDDFYLIHHSKDYLRYCLYSINEFVNTLELELNGKTQIFPVKNGVNYLGFHTYLTKDGKVIRKLKNQNKRNAQKKFKKMRKLLDEGKITEDKFNASYNAWKSHILHGNCYKLSKMMDNIIYGQK